MEGESIGIPKFVQFHQISVAPWNHLLVPGIIVGPVIITNVTIIVNNVTTTIVKLICSHLLGLDKGANIGKSNKATK